MVDRIENHASPARMTSSLAKITAPTARRALNRDGVFCLLDEYAGRQLTWLSAPAGYGKTTAEFSNIIEQEIKFSPGGTTGWHKHPGIVVLTLAADSDPVDWYDSRCGKTVYHAGDSWTEGTKLHDVVNRGSIDAHFLVTYIIAKDVTKRTDESAPRCAGALGL